MHQVCSQNWNRLFWSFIAVTKRRQALQNKYFFHVTEMYLYVKNTLLGLFFVVCKYYLLIMSLATSHVDVTGIFHRFSYMPLQTCHEQFCFLYSFLFGSFVFSEVHPYLSWRTVWNFSVFKAVMFRDKASRALCCFH